MPIYEFRCHDCGEKFEQLCPLGETGANVRCPRCAGKQITRLMSAFSAPGTGGGNKGCTGCKATSCSSCH